MCLESCKTLLIVFQRTCQMFDENFRKVQNEKQIIKISPKRRLMQIIFIPIFLIGGVLLWNYPLSLIIDLSWAPFILVFILKVVLPVFLMLAGLIMFNMYMRSVKYANKLLIIR